MYSCDYRKEELSPLECWNSESNIKNIKKIKKKQAEKMYICHEEMMQKGLNMFKKQNV
jgi:hypothetical protein